MMEADGIDTVAAATEVQPKTMLIHLSSAIVSATNGAQDADTLCTSAD